MRHAAGAEPLMPARMRLIGMYALIEAGDRHRRFALAIEPVMTNSEQPEAGALLSKAITGQQTGTDRMLTYRSADQR